MNSHASTSDPHSAAAGDVHVDVDVEAAPSSSLEDVNMGADSPSAESDPSGITPSEKYATARMAHAEGDEEAMRRAHDQPLIVHGAEAHHTGAGNYIKSIVFGGLDGIITTFAVVAGVAGAALSPSIVLILGFANVFADGLSMGLGDYISSRAEQQFAKNERKREMWECEKYLDGEKKEMVELYKSKGMPHEDAVTIVDIMAKDKKMFVDIMMIEELGLMPDDEGENPAKSGAITFGSFIIFGTIPLLAYLDASKDTSGSRFDVRFMISIVLTALTLFALGCLKGRFVGQSSIISGFYMLVNGGAAALASFIISFAVESALT